MRTRCCTCGTFLFPLPAGRKSLWLTPLHHHHPLQRRLRLFVGTPPDHQGEKHSASMGQMCGAASALTLCATLCFPLQLLYESGVCLCTSFLFLSACSLIHLLRTFFLLPKKFIPYPLPDDYTYGYDLQQSARRRSPRCKCAIVPESDVRICYLNGMTS